MRSPLYIAFGTRKNKCIVSLVGVSSWHCALKCLIKFLKFFVAWPKNITCSKYKRCRQHFKAFFCVSYSVFFYRFISERGECDPHRMDDEFLIRFLRARNFIPQRAHRLVCIHFNWEFYNFVLKITKFNRIFY